ncbi:MAG: hypothetical protein D6794_09825 [Deltaproteobacteria bacterium]|nr:MAG: hypothetical protein D6794_09825 [Deltaproteobacteria bacterium]
MALFKKLFSSKSPQEQARRFFEQGDYIRLLQFARERQLDDDESLALVDRARAILSRKNLEEARLRFDQGDVQAAEEHLGLARQFGASDEELAAVKPQVDRASETAASTSPTCRGCPAPSGGEGESPEKQSAAELDEQDTLELLLAGLDEGTAENYRNKSGSFHRALVAAGQGDDQTALACLEDCPEQDRDALYEFELASVLYRCGRSEEGMQALKRCLAARPRTVLPWEMAVDLALQGDVMAGLEEMLDDLAREPECAAWANQLLCRLAWQTGAVDVALKRGQAALDCGSQDPEVLQIVALCLERQGDVDMAERVLGRLPVAGCGGGIHPLLAEFWLRQKKNLDKVLEGFKTMARQDPGNPLWQLRIAETCVALGWTKEALKIVEALEHMPDGANSLGSALEQLRLRIQQT